MPDSNTAWKILLAWFCVSVAIMAFVGAWPLVAYVITYAVVFGGLAWKYRDRVRPLFKRLKLDNFKGYMLLAVIVTITEELWCWVLGCTLAHPNILVDLFFVTLLWSVWFATWYLYLARKFRFTEKAALLTAASIGVLFEYATKPEMILNPAVLAVSIPLGVLVYAAIFLLPMQLITFDGKKESWVKYPVSVTLPYLLTIPVAILVYIILAALGVL